MLKNLPKKATAQRANAVPTVVGRAHALSLVCDARHWVQPEKGEGLERVLAVAKSAHFLPVAHAARR